MSPNGHSSGYLSRDRPGLVPVFTAGLLTVWFHQWRCSSGFTSQPGYFFIFLIYIIGSTYYTFEMFSFVSTADDSCTSQKEVGQDVQQLKHWVRFKCRLLLCNYLPQSLRQFVTNIWSLLVILWATCCFLIYYWPSFSLRSVSLLWHSLSLSLSSWFFNSSVEALVVHVSEPIRARTIDV